MADTVVRDAFNAVYQDGPSSEPDMPRKEEIRPLGTVIDNKIDTARSALELSIAEIEEQVQSAVDGLIQKSTWTELTATPGTRDGQPGRVAGPDAGTHTDPVVGGTVNNLGEYAWIAASSDWQRMDDLLVAKTAPVAASFKDSLGFIGMQLRADGTFIYKGESRSYEFVETASADEYLSVSDPLGFKLLSLTSEQLKAPGLSSAGDGIFNEGFDASPIIGGHLVAFEGLDTRIYARNVLPQRSDLSRVRATFYSEAALDGSRPPYSRSGDDELVVDLQKCGPTVYMQTRLDEINPDIRHQAALSVATPPVAPGSLNTATVLMIGDSITNRQMAAWVNALASQNGYTLTFIGTINGAGINQISSDASGPFNEGREGWQFGDFTYAVNDRALIIAPGDEGAYLISSKNTKWEQNPFIRAAAGGDDPSVIRNGYVFDFDFYLDRFTLADPDVVFIGLGTNDIRDLNSPDLGPAITDGLTIMCGQILAARPATKIVIWFPPVSRSSDRDTLWSSEYVEVLSRLIKFVRDQANPNIRIVPTWAMASQEVGFSLDTGTTSDIGIKTAGLFDTVHLGQYNIATVAQILAAATAAVAQGDL